MLASPAVSCAPLWNRPEARICGSPALVLVPCTPSRVSLTVLSIHSLSGRKATQAPTRAATRIVPNNTLRCIEANLHWVQEWFRSYGWVSFVSLGRELQCHLALRG